MKVDTNIIAQKVFRPNNLPSWANINEEAISLDEAIHELNREKDKMGLI
jgi:hypothetical protein